MNESFRVEPVRHYDLARYHSVRDGGAASPGDEVWLTRRVAALLLFGGMLSFACCAETPPPAPATPTYLVQRAPIVIVLPPEERVVVNTTPRPLVVPVVVVRECLPAERRCQGSRTLLLCRDDHWSALDCVQQCHAQLGPNGISGGCSETAADPCQCERDSRYDIIDGF